MRPMISVLKWTIALALWAFGAFLLWEIWQYQKTLADPLGSYVEFAVMFITTFYGFALIPIKISINNLFGESRDLSTALLES